MTLLCAFIITAACFSAKAQEKDEKVLREMVDEGDFIFKAQTALPMTGGSRHLTSAYDLKVSEDEVIAYLPYFGRAFRAPSDLRGGGIDFKSTKFEYTVEERKRGGWNVHIEPNDAEDIRQLFLTVSESGSASLRVNSDRRQSISFNGYIEKRPAEDTAKE